MGEGRTGWIRRWVQPARPSMEQKSAISGRPGVVHGSPGPSSGSARAPASSAAATGSSGSSRNHGGRVWAGAVRSTNQAKAGVCSSSRVQPVAVSVR